MFDLRLTAEQLEFRDTVRDFVEHEVKAAALNPARLEPFEKPLLTEVLDKASRIGLRTLALSEGAGGAGADQLTSCIVMEELAAGDVDVASALALTSQLAHMLFDELMTSEQQKRFLPEFLEDNRYHLALSHHDPDSTSGWHYHRPTLDASDGGATAVKQGNGDWLLNGSIPFVPNAPVAKLFAIDVRTHTDKTGRDVVTTLLVPRDTKGFAVNEPLKAIGGRSVSGAATTRWHHGTGAAVTFNDCRIPAANVLGREGLSALANAAHSARSATQTAAVNLGLGRAAFETAVDYAKIRIQGGRRIIEHQAIGTLLADLTIQLELARNIVWKAAWTSEHPEAVADRSVAELPLHTIARVYTAEAVNKVALGAAECFGAMGVMRDMPLQKYVHDSFVFLHAADNDSATKLKIAEAVAGYERPLAA